MAVKQTAQPAPAARQRVSLKRDDFTSSGILPEGDYKVIESSFVMFQYQNKDGQLTGATTCAHRMLLQPIVNGVPTGDTTDQNYSVGDPKSFAPSADGNHLEAVGDRATLSKSSNYFIEYDALVNAGVPEDLYDEQGAGLLVGMEGHIVHIPAPDRSRLRAQSAVGTGVVPQQQQEKKREFPDTIPVFKSISKAPWDTKGGKKAVTAAKPASKSNGAPAPSNGTSNEGADNRLAAFIADVIKGEGKVARTKVRLMVHKKYNEAKIEASERDAELSVFNDQAQLDDLLASVSCVMEGNDIVLVE